MARGADQMITSAIDMHVEGERGRDGDGEDRKPGALLSAGSQAR
jgi:hypothetical protein